MGAIGIVALIIQLIVVFVILGGWFLLATMPGRIARKRGHPQAEAIGVAGFFGALTMGILSPLAFVWAYTKPVVRPIDVAPEAAASPPESTPTTDEETD